MRQELQAAMDESSEAGPQTRQILDGRDQPHYPAAGIIRQQVHSSIDDELPIPLVRIRWT